MNSEEAKSILQVFRPGIDDDADPIFADALALLKKDPELSQWLARETAFDETISAKLNQISPPGPLKDKLFGLQNRPKSSSGQEQKGVSWWQNPVMLSMAASFVVLLTFIGLVFKPASLQAKDLPRFYEAISNHVQATPSLEAKSDDLNELRHYLKSQASPAPGDLTIPLKTIGCYSYQWEGRPVAVVCMGSKPEVHHLYIVNRNDFPQEEHPTRTAFQQKGDHALAAWADEENIYVLVVKGHTQQLKEIL